MQDATKALKASQNTTKILSEMHGTTSLIKSGTKSRAWRLIRAEGFLYEYENFSRL